MSSLATIRHHCFTPPNIVFGNNTERNGNIQQQDRHSNRRHGECPSSKSYRWYVFKQRIKFDGTKHTKAVLAWLALQLSKQKRNDFKPRNDDQYISGHSTEPCAACCDMLGKVRDAAFASLSGKNLEAFLTEIGVSFHT